MRLKLVHFSTKEEKQTTIGIPRIFTMQQTPMVI